MNYKARIKFDNKEWLVIDNIEYKGIKYYYIIEDKSEEMPYMENLDAFKGNIALEFIYEIGENRYKNVTDQDLFDELLAIVGENVLKNLDEDVGKEFLARIQK